MSLVHMNIGLAFMVAFLGLLMYRSHLMSSLLCLEGMMLILFIVMTIMVLNTHFTLANMLPIILVSVACEAAIGLSILVMVSNTYGIDYVQNLKLLQC